MSGLLEGKVERVQGTSGGQESVRREFARYSWLAGAVPAKRAACTTGAIPQQAVPAWAGKGCIWCKQEENSGR